MAGYIGSKASVVSSGAERKKTFTITGATTSLTGLNYTVGKVHVFQNGVRLVDGTDYTATNGTSITLTVAAQSGDNVVVISQAAFQVADALLTSGGTMTGDLTVQGAFTSKGIDDNGDATAITIDSSENVLIGKTSSSYNTVGSELLNNGVYKGLGQFTTDGTNALTLNRKSSDGEIAIFRKDGTTVGSIQSRAGSITSLVLNPSGSDGAGFTGGSNAILPVSASALVDNTIDLGVGSYRYNDLFLGGGVYLGGTGSANKLDDYETGTGDSTITGTGGGTLTTANDKTYRYTKIGNLVHFQTEFSITGISGVSGAIQVALPFTSVDYAAGSLRAYLVTYSGNSLFCEVEPSGSKVIIKSHTSNSATINVLSTGYYFVTIQYMT